MIGVSVIERVRVRVRESERNSNKLGGWRWRNSKALYLSVSII